MTILMKGEFKGKYLLPSTESTFHLLSTIMNWNSPEWGNFFTPRIGLYRSAKMGRENVIIQLKEDTQCQFAWDYEHEKVRKLFNFNFPGGKRKIVLIPFSICAYHFCGTVNLKSKGRDDFFKSHFIIVYLYNRKLNLLAGGRIHVFLKGVSDSQGSKPNTEVLFLAASKKDSFVTHKNSLTKANYFLAVKTLLDLVRIQCLFQLLSSMSK